MAKNETGGIVVPGRKLWTRRGDMLLVDKEIIRATADTNRAAARIFVTGEVLEEYIGEIAVRHLLSINDVYYQNGAGEEPLFVQTRNNTVRMTRFDPEVVWRCFHPDILKDALQDEIERLGINMDPWEMEHTDFYQSMVASMKKEHGGAVFAVPKKPDTDAFYHGMYLSCLLLFGKPCYMDVPASEHFATAEAASFLKDADFQKLSAAESKKLDALREEYGKLHALTNPEMMFIVERYEHLKDSLAEAVQKGKECEP